MTAAGPKPRKLCLQLSGATAPASKRAHLLKVTTTTAATAPRAGGPSPMHGPSSLPAHEGGRVASNWAVKLWLLPLHVSCTARLPQRLHGMLTISTPQSAAAFRTRWEHGGALHRRRHPSGQVL